MNQYGAMAQTHWARFLPVRYSRIEDPTPAFTEDEFRKARVSEAGQECVRVRR